MSLIAGARYPSPMLAPRLETNITKMKVIRLLSWSHLFAAVLVPFFRDWGGLDYGQIMLVNAWFWMWNTLLEVPTGTVADVFGRKVSIAIGCFAAGIATLIYASTPHIAVFLLAEFIFAFWITLTSGADEALVYDTLAALGREDEAKQTFARLESYKLGGIVTGALLGGPIADWLGVRAPMLLMSVPFALSGLLAMTMAEPRHQKTEERAAYLDTLWSGVRYFRGHAELRVLAFDMVGSQLFTFFVIWFYQPQLERVGIGIGFFGLVHAAMCMSQILVLQHVERLEALVGSKRRYLFLSALAPGVGYLVLAWGGGLVPTLGGILFIAALGLSRPPLFLGYMNRYIPSENRATVLSAVAMLRTLGATILNPLAGFLADRSMTTAFVVFALCAFGVALLSRVREEHLDA